MQLPVKVSHRSDVGREPEENQDSIGYICDERRGVHLLIVADGVGGAVCGHIASQLAVQTIRQSFFASERIATDLGERLAYSISEANRTIIHRASRDRHCKGMGSTCAALVIAENLAWVAHTGDSRIYLIRGNRIIQLTRDHSQVQRMLDNGLLTEEEALNHPDRNCLEQALGMREEIKVDLRPAPIQVEIDDIFLACTDGLTNLVRDEEIYRMVRQCGVEVACESLISLANERGGYDNISVGLLRLGEEPAFPLEFPPADLFEN